MMNKERNIFSIINEYRKSIPVDLRGLLKELGIDLMFSNLDNDISGIIESVGKTYRIIVNESHSETRQRFTIAHELGHYVFHRNLIGNGIYDNKAYRCSYPNQYNNPNINSVHETEANKFAVSLLIPNDELERNKAITNHLETHEQVRRLAEKFNVSKQAMAIRLDVNYP
ncbi:MAG: ImmA/IrrE family metallo-endopeptidase [Candidatus Auribacterota bacterium]